jgi:hypothetical protein
MPAPAGAVRWVFEPAAIGADRLDAVHEKSGLVSRTVPRIGAGIGLELRRGVQLAALGGLGAATTDFGVLAGPTARIARADAAVELRARLPWRVGGFSAQGAAGAGRLRFAYHPDRVTLDTSGGALVIDLEPVAAWTRHLAAEVLHSYGQTEIGVRCAWRSYALDVARPEGVHRESARDLHVGMVLRVQP